MVLGKGGSDEMRWDIWSQQARKNLILKICLALSLWVLSSLAWRRRDGKALLFPTLHRKSSDNLAGRRLGWHEDNEVQVSHSNQASPDSDTLGSLQVHLDPSLFHLLPPLSKALFLDRKLVDFYKTNWVTQTWHFAVRIFSPEVPKPHKL